MKTLGAVALTLFAMDLSAATFTVTTNADTGAGSLRDAITQANATPGADTIGFNIPGGGVQTITPQTALPAIAEALVIDGYTQPGSAANFEPVGTAAVLLIRLDGSVAGGTGVSVTGGGTTIQGLILNGWPVAIATANLGGNVIRGNFIGTDPTGTSAVANQAGINAGADNETIGGTSPSDRNLVSGNAPCCGPAGISVSGHGSIVQGNLVGTNAAGTAAIPNGIGVVLGTVGGTGTTFGGAASGAGNVVSGNGTGINITQNAPNIVQGNRIGTTANGAGRLGNGVGILLSLGGNESTIGGTAAGEGNSIAFNTAQGILAGDAGVNNTIRGNSIVENGGLGIDLGNVGPTANDSLDPDPGSNLLQNFPIIQSVEYLPGSTRIQGKFNSLASTTFLLDFYSSFFCSNPRALVEGDTYLGEEQVTTNGAGNATFDVTFPVGLVNTSPISATATDPNGNTSEFSQRIVFSVTPISGPEAGGTALTIAGTDFANPTTVTIGGVDAGAGFVSNTQLTATSPPLPAGTAADIVATTPDGTTATFVKGWVSDFLDVPPAHPFHSFVVTLVANGVTSGVGSGNYGVDQPTLRQQMAVFLLKAKYGICAAPASCTGVFDDVTCPSQFADWIEGLASEGVTGGCQVSPPLYCPTNPVLRQQMAVFLLKARFGSGHVPPPCTGVFDDVPCPSQFADWIEELAALQVTGGCSVSPPLYCPLNPVTRGQMAVFLTKMFELP